MFRIRSCFSKKIVIQWILASFICWNSKLFQSFQSSKHNNLWRFSTKKLYQPQNSSVLLPSCSWPSWKHSRVMIPPGEAFIHRKNILYLFQRDRNDQINPLHCCKVLLSYLLNGLSKVYTTPLYENWFRSGWIGSHSHSLSMQLCYFLFYFEVLPPCVMFWL